MALNERVYLLTGAGGGIGEGTATALLESGARLVLLDLEAPDAVAAQVDPEGGGRALAFAADVTSESDAAAAVEKALSHFGRLDGLVHAAGVINMDSAWEASLEDWRRQLEVNVTGSFVVSRVVAKHLRTHGGGAMVLVASNCGKVGYPNMAAYNSSKSAVIGLTRSLAMEWASDGINVNAVCPGSVETPMLEGVAEWLAPRLDLEVQELLDGMVPQQMGRRIQPVEVGRVIAFLLSDAATIIRGQSINIDGGDTPY